MGNEFFNSNMQLFLGNRMDWERYFKLRRGAEVNVPDELETDRSVLQTLDEICVDIAASARDHWHEEAKLVDGRVVVPPHIAQGYDKLRKAGLVCLPLGTEYNGYGLPLLLNIFYLEMIARADSSLMTIVGLQTGVASDIEKYGSDELKKQYLPRFASGELQGSMDLTEAQAGSDLGGIVTRMTEQDGRFFLDGEKIFITNGGAQVHLVLARDAETYEKSKGSTTGLSLMLCPTVLPDGSANRVRVSRVESKIGIHGSPTCVVDLEHTEGFLLGRRGEGFRAMLDLMNNARLGVAAQAIGVAEASFREALEYAQQRVQFGAPIIEQPLVKSLLTQMVLNIQAARALLYRTCAMIDLNDALRLYLESERGAGDPNRATLDDEYQRSLGLIRFLTPLCKFYASEISNDVTRKGIQVHGGIGYMTESPAAHYHSDSIITTIYEGTSEIQASFALKEMSKGALFTTLERIRDEIEPLRAQFPELVGQLCEAINKWISQSLPALMGDPQYALLNAKRVCEMVIDVFVAGELLLQAGLDEAKQALAHSFINRRMLAVEMNARRIASGDASRIRRYDQILRLGS
jgi:alkylation response protein AidB-like acyl-CoA dehydrogenase